MHFPQGILVFFSSLFSLLLLMVPLFRGNADEVKTTPNRVLQHLLEERYQLVRRLLGFGSESPYHFSTYQYHIPRAASEIILKDLEKKIHEQENMFAARYGAEALMTELLVQPRYQLQVIKEFNELVMAGAILQQEWSQAFLGPNPPLSVNASKLEHMLLAKLRKTQILLTLINGDTGPKAPGRTLLHNIFKEFHQLLRANAIKSAYPQQGGPTTQAYPILRSQIPEWTIAKSWQKLLEHFNQLFPKECDHALSSVL